MLRALIVLPTYNEAENIDDVLRKVRAVVPDAGVLVVDDGSPDGTADLADALGEELGQITVMRRTEKNGLGAAYRAGFRWGLDEGYEALVEMDSDLSHDPAALPSLISAVEHGASLAIGSRYVPGGSTPNWPVHRRLLSRWGNRYTAAVLGLGVADATSGFRAYRAETLRTIHPETTRSSGYAFMSELARRMIAEGAEIVELPITFVDRAYGTSKMSARIITESMALVTAWGVKSRLPGRRP